MPPTTASKSSRLDRYRRGGGSPVFLSGPAASSRFDGGAVQIPRDGPQRPMVPPLSDRPRRKGVSLPRPLSCISPFRMDDVAHAAATIASRAAAAWPEVDPGASPVGRRGPVVPPPLPNVHCGDPHQRARSEFSLYIRSCRNAGSSRQASPRMPEFVIDTRRNTYSTSIPTSPSVGCGNHAFAHLRSAQALSSSQAMNCAGARGTDACFQIADNPVASDMKGKCCIPLNHKSDPSQSPVSPGYEAEAATEQIDLKTTRASCFTNDHGYQEPVGDIAAFTEPQISVETASAGDSPESPPVPEKPAGFLLEASASEGLHQDEHDGSPDACNKAAKGKVSWRCSSPSTVGQSSWETGSRAQKLKWGRADSIRLRTDLLPEQKKMSCKRPKAKHYCLPFAYAFSDPRFRHIEEAPCSFPEVLESINLGGDHQLGNDLFLY